MKLHFDSDLPLPPTINQYYKVAKNRLYKTSNYAKTIRSYVKPNISDKRLLMSVTVHFAKEGKQDLDNRLKALQDAFNGVLYHDDSQIDYLVVGRGKTVKGGKVHVMIWELSEHF